MPGLRNEALRIYPYRTPWMSGLLQGFAATIEALLRESRGSSLHTGKKYRATSIHAPGKSDAATLRLELAVAIKKEEFERAALLRDAFTTCTCRSPNDRKAGERVRIVKYPAA